MDLLERSGVRSELSREDMTAALTARCTDEQLKTLRGALFEEAKESGLAHPKDVLVKRLNRACGPPLRRNLAQDVSELVYVFKTRQPVPRVILKNGKRALSVFTETRDRRESQPSSPPVTSTSSEPIQEDLDIGNGMQLNDIYPILFRPSQR